MLTNKSRLNSQKKSFDKKILTKNKSYTAIFDYELFLKLKKIF